MDDPPKARPCVQAGKMPAIPGKRPCGAVFPWEASADRVDLPGETQNEKCRREARSASAHSSPSVAARSPRETVESVVERTNTPRAGAVMVSTSSP